MSDLTKVEQVLLDQSLEDFVGLWWLVAHARQDGVDDATMRPAIVAMLSRLLSEGRIAAGQFAEDRTFHLWHEPVTDIVERIDREWRALGHDPMPGDIAWFVEPRTFASWRWDPQ
jgi:hypothetical protein